MIRTPVTSTNLKSVDYDPKTRLLTLEFRNQRIYTYEGVEPHVHHVLIHAESVGKAFFNLIHGHYVEREVTEPVPSVIQGDRPEGNVS